MIMHALITSLILLPLVVGCAFRGNADSSVRVSATELQHVDLPLFSQNAPVGVPEGWRPLVILRDKKQTQYQLVRDAGESVLHARAESASSALMHETMIDPLRQPWLQWRWKVAGFTDVTGDSQGTVKDSPVRIVLGFDGDKDSLSFADQVLFETAKIVTGHDFPYATLMYVWAGDAPVDTIIRSPYSNRIKMVVVESGQDVLGHWQHFSRNIVEDYERAFGEKPGKLIGIGVLTDSDNTGQLVEAWYGDIRLLQGPAHPARIAASIK